MPSCDIFMSKNILTSLFVPLDNAITLVTQHVKIFYDAPGWCLRAHRFPGYAYLHYCLNNKGLFLFLFISAGCPPKYIASGNAK
ncbi:hypothetical protein ED28_12865 [[Pantoea] beijingensis]|uniref:Uncharacterized protein n=1 Tax=[Pantoea] beijingensis TaxID=1324864 RepID=A0A443IB67_9GAMM|nr:hypothetical protein ED28_12865 [[Pantoea] beijingensis]